MIEEIIAHRVAMHDAAAESFFAAQRYGKNSPQYMTQIAIYSDRAKAYEDKCRSFNREPYATYSED